MLLVGEAAALLGVSPATVRNWEPAGRLTGERVGAGRDRRYRREEVERLAGRVAGRGR